MKSRSSKLTALALGGLFALAGSPASALEYRSVEAPAAIFYDAPSQKGRKLFVVRRHTPLEVVVNLEGWVKVRDAEGTLAWIEKKALSDKRMLIVTAGRADVRLAANAESALVFEAEKGVALELADAQPKDGWVRVRHADGQSGYVRVTQIWGL